MKSNKKKLQIKVFRETALSKMVEETNKFLTQIAESTNMNWQSNSFHIEPEGNRTYYVCFVNYFITEA